MVGLKTLGFYFHNMEGNFHNVRTDLYQKAKIRIHSGKGLRIWVIQEDPICNNNFQNLFRVFEKSMAINKNSPT